MRLAPIHAQTQDHHWEGGFFLGGGASKQGCVTSGIGVKRCVGFGFVGWGMCFGICAYWDVYIGAWARLRARVSPEDLGSHRLGVHMGHGRRARGLNEAWATG